MPESEYNRDKLLTSIGEFLDTKASTAVNAGDAEMCDVLVDVAATLARLTK